MDKKLCPRCNKKMRVIAVSRTTGHKEWKCSCGVQGWDGQIRDMEK